MKGLARRRELVLAVAVPFALVGCGTRVSNTTSALKNAPASQSAAPSAAPRQAVETDQVVSAPVDGGGQPAAPGSGPSRANTAPPQAPAAGAALPAGQRPDGAAGQRPEPGQQANSKRSAPDTSVQQPDLAGAPSGGTTDEPVVLGSIGNYSGPPGVSSLPILEGAQIWVKTVNARGGLKGRPVKLIVYDDGSDPAKHRAQMQDAVERQQVLAFLTNPDPISGAGSVDYVDAKRVPVMGGSTGESYAYTSPMYFVPFTSTPALGRIFAPSIAQQVSSRGMDRVGSLVCAEAAACTEVEKGLEAGAAKAGLKDVYKARRSLVQPDFTAECLAARNAGVQVLLITMDGGGVRRIANSCARQSYNPVIAIPGVIQDDAFKDEAGISEMVTFSGVFPHFQTGTPELDEFHTAVKSYAKKGKPSGGLAMGWTSGKLLERAVRDIPAAGLTREALLAGLWSIKDDNLGGLSYPLTFVENRPAQQVACWFNIGMRNKTWSSPDGFTLRCD